MSEAYFNNVYPSRNTLGKASGYQQESGYTWEALSDDDMHSIGAAIRGYEGMGPHSNDTVFPDDFFKLDFKSNLNSNFKSIINGN